MNATGNHIQSNVVSSLFNSAAIASLTTANALTQLAVWGHLYISKLYMYSG